MITPFEILLIGIISTAVVNGVGIIKDSEEIISMEDNEKCRVLQQDEIEYLKLVKSHSVTRRYYIIYKVENVANTVDESIKAINV